MTRSTKRAEAVTIGTVDMLGRDFLQPIKRRYPCAREKRGVRTSAILLASKIERDLISERTSAALQVRKAAGQVLGRPKGSKLDSQADEINRYMDLGLSKTAVSKLLGISQSALYSWMNRRM